MIFFYDQNFEDLLSQQLSNTQHCSINYSHPAAVTPPGLTFMLRLEVGSRDPLHAHHPPRFDESQDGSEHRGFRVFVRRGGWPIKIYFFRGFGVRVMLAL